MKDSAQFLGQLICGIYYVNTLVQKVRSSLVLSLPLAQALG